jgi:hypothetical protein
VCDFLANQYQQGKATIVASGDVDEDLLQRAALKAFVRLHTRKLGERAHPPAIGPQPGTVHVQADIDEPAALIATWPLPPMGSQEYRMVQAVWPTIPSVLGLWGFVWKWGHSSFSQVLGGAHAPVLAVGIYLNSPNDAGEAKSFVEKSVRTALEDLGHDREDPRWRPVWQNRIESLLAR